MYQKLRIPYHVVDYEVIEQLHPCVNTTSLFGAAHTPTDGHVDPSSTTYALAKAAKSLGASVVTRDPVEAISQDAHCWLVHTKE